ncbi:MAG TPA: DUF1206 domain-containing protein [Vicinamibacterales bacterium]|nr:DUF1206 domain-containing protein [Vicinamibacterales bacterium]
MPSVRPWVARVVRLGYLAKGLIYSLIGVLALRVALGMRGGRLTDPSGVLRTVLSQPFGRIMLALIGVGIVGYAAYYIFEAVADLRGHGGGRRGWSARGLTMIKAAVYGTVGIQALLVVFFNYRPMDGTETGAGVVMAFPLGQWLLMAIGIGVAVYGISQLRMVLRGRLEGSIDISRVRREAPWLLSLGRFGIAARSVILILMGWTFARSGWRGRASDADGIREALRTIASFDAWLLAAIGAGLLCFGVYQLCHARYVRLAIR